MRGACVSIGKDFGGELPKNELPKNEESRLGIISEVELSSTRHNGVGRKSNYIEARESKSLRSCEDISLLEP